MLRRNFASATIAFVLSMLAAADATAAGQRSFVRSSGADVGTCTLTVPCRSFGYAITQTNTGGEVIVLDSAGYGPVTITQSVSIIAPAGVYAGISVFSGNGIVVDGANIVVTLRGLTINGQCCSPLYGIHFKQGSILNVEDCEIDGMDTGLRVTADGSVVAVKNSVLRENVYGFLAQYSVPGGLASLDHVNLPRNSYGVYAGNGSRVTVSNSVVAHNTLFGVTSYACCGYETDIVVRQSVVTGNPDGLYVRADPPAIAGLVSDGNAITYSSVAAFHLSGSGGFENIYSPGNNTAGYYGALIIGGSLSPLPPM